MIPSTHAETTKAYELGRLGSLGPQPGLDSFGNYNTAPEPMVAITAEEYSHRLLHWQVLAIESRQPGIPDCKSLRIHWLNTGNGIGLSSTRQSGPGSRRWVPIYWLIGCPHNNIVATKTGNCLTAQVCQDCGYRTVIDSSG